jgi:hypothetical protein
MSSEFWTPERVEKLRKLWIDEDRSAGFIAKVMKTTRSAICGKANRMGWRVPHRVTVKGSNSNGMSTVVRFSLKEQRIMPPKINADGLHDLPAEDVPTAKPIALKEGGECAWPVGDDRACCAPIVRGGYCAAHAERAYRPAAPIDLKSLLKAAA